MFMPVGLPQIEIDRNCVRLLLGEMNHAMSAELFEDTQKSALVNTSNDGFVQYVEQVHQ